MACVAVCAVLVGVRFFWVFVATYLPRLVARRWRGDNPAPPWQGIFVVAFTGIRGVVSLAAALSIPLMAGWRAFPAARLLLLVTFAVILVTLVGQGLTLPWVIGCWASPSMAGARRMRKSGGKSAPALASIDAALARLDGLEAAASAPETWRP